MYWYATVPAICVFSIVHWCVRKSEQDDLGRKEGEREKGDGDVKVGKEEERTLFSASPESPKKDTVTPSLTNRRSICLLINIKVLKAR